MNDIMKQSGPRRRVINPRGALIVFFVAASVVISTKHLHDRQFGKTLQFLQAAAYEALEKEDFRAAQRKLTQYLAMKPGDLAARERLSWLLTEHIRTRPALEQAFRLNEELLRINTTQDDLRLRQARTAVELSLMADAEAHLKLLQTSKEDNSEVWYLSSRTAIARRDTNAAVICLKRAIKCPSPQPEAFAELAQLATESTSPEFLPDALMQEIVTRCPGADAHRLRAEWLVENGRIDDAMRDLWTALDESPDSLVLNTMLVQCLQSTPALTPTSDATTARSENGIRAIRHLRTQIDLTPLNTQLRICLAAVQWNNAEKPEATRTLEDGIRRNARAFVLHETLIEYLVSDGDPAKARRVLQSIPDRGLPRSHQSFCEGRILMAEGKWKEAANEIERCLAFAEKGPGFYARVELSLAVCRSRAGEADGSIDAFRSVIESNPESLTGRLGIASAWVRSGQIELAVAEYRQMLNVPGVPAYLADILIQKAMRQPAAIRDWSEIDRIITETTPLIPDPVQRALLRADRLFASGQITHAITSLEQASRKFPDRPQIDRALKRLHGEHAAGLRDRLLQLAQEEPDNVDVHAAIVRQYLADGELSEGLNWLEKIALRSPVDREIAIQVTLATLARIVTLENHISRETYLADLQKTELLYARELAAINVDHLAQLSRILVRAGRTDEALKLLHDQALGGSADSVAAGLLEIVRFAPDRGPLLQPVIQELYALIRRHPENTKLRLAYVDLMLFAKEYSNAMQTLEPLRNMASDDGRLAARRAWILAVQGQNPGEASELAATAIRMQPGEYAHKEVLSRVLMAQEKFPEAVGVLNAIPVEHQSLAARTYLAKVLQMLDRDDDARRVLDEIATRLAAEPLFPADEDLLDSVRKQLRQPAAP